MKKAAAILILLIPIPGIAATSQQAHIIFYRKKTMQMGSITATVLIDGTKAFRMPRGTYYDLTAHPRTYKLDLPTKAQPTLLLHMKPGETAYVRVLVFKKFFTLQGRHLMLKRMPAATAQKQMQGLKPLPARLISPSIAKAIAEGNL